MKKAQHIKFRQLLRIALPRLRHRHPRRLRPLHHLHPRGVRACSMANRMVDPDPAWDRRVWGGVVCAVSDFWGGVVCAVLDFWFMGNRPGTLEFWSIACTSHIFFALSLSLAFSLCVCFCSAISTGPFYSRRSAATTPNRFAFSSPRAAHPAPSSSSLGSHPNLLYHPFVLGRLEYPVPSPCDMVAAWPLSRWGIRRAVV